MSGIRWSKLSRLKVLALLMSVTLIASISNALQMGPEDSVSCKSLLASNTGIDPIIVKELSSLYLTLFADEEQTSAAQDRPRNNAIWNSQIRKTANELGVDPDELTKAISVEVKQIIDQSERDNQSIKMTQNRIREQQQDLAEAGICKRNAAVVRAIENKLESSCQQITDDDLSQIKILEVKGINGSLNANDFRGLTGLFSLDLLKNPGLTSLTQGIFDQLGSLSFLRIRDNPDLTSLQSGIFDQIGGLIYLDLSGNPGLTSLPPGIFDQLGSLRHLWLYNNHGLTSFSKWMRNQSFNLKTIRLLKIELAHRRILWKKIEELKKRGVCVEI